MPVVPARPGLDFVFRIRASIAPARSGGPGRNGERLHIAITGGTVDGPRLTGTIAAGGSDWPLVRPDGSSAISARYTIVAADGTPVYVRNDGLRVSNPEVTARLRAGDPVDPSEFYFRSAPVFEAPEGAHAWLNEAIFVASLCRDADQVVVDVFRVT
ncbi:MAG: DUF3237 domain-containing protein [Rhizobiaceae bacterium]|nr:DUF3237 domain-containing protein [Rhizobiaceae bacterium]